MEAALAAARHRTLLVSREPFNVPRRQEEIRKGHRRTAEDAAQHARPRFGTIEVDDVRELVGEDQPKPVVGLADEVRAGGPRRGDHDHVVGNRRREAVREFRLIDQNHVGACGRGSAERTRAPGS